MDYLRNNVDLVERSIYAKSGRSNDSNDFKNQIIITEQEKRKDNERESVPNLRKDLSTSFVSTADSSFLKYLQNSQHSKDFNDLYIKEHEQFEELVSDEMIQNALSYLPSDVETVYLVKLFLEVCETNYFYIHPQNFLGMLDIYLQKKSQKNMVYLKQNWFFLIILFGVLAISSGYEYIGEGCSLPSVTNSMLGLDDPGKVFYKASLPFVGLLLKSNSVHCVQALLLLGLFLTTNESNTNSTIHHGYLYIYLSVEKAIISKLHITHLNMDPLKREFEARLWWSCYCLERRYGINLGKPEIIKREEITAQLPQHCELLNKTDGSSNYLNQRASIELTFIICKISGLIYDRYQTTRKSEDYVCLDFKIIKDLLTELEDWNMKYSTIIGDFNMLDPNSSLYRAQIHLTLNYLLAKVYVGKPFLLYKVENSSSTPGLESTETHFIDYLTSICVDSAFRIIQLLCTLNKCSKLAIYSATDLNFCNLSLYVIVLLLKIDKSNSTMLFLKKGLKILKILSKGCASAKVTFSRLSKLEFLLSNSFENVDQNEDLLEFHDEMKIEGLDFSQFPDSEIEFKNFSFYNEGMESMKLPYNIKMHHNQTTNENHSSSNSFKGNSMGNITNTDFPNFGDTIGSSEHSDSDNFFEDWTKDIDYFSFDFPLND